MRIEGTAHVIGDAIDTDQILPGKYLHIDNKSDFGDHVLEGYDPSLGERLEEGDVIVAGENLGLGSSREAAPLALKYAGVGAVVAESFSRIFYRNCINVGLPLAEVNDVTDYVDDGDVVSVDLSKGEFTNVTDETSLPSGTLPQNLQEILEAGGLVEYQKQQLE